MTNESPDSNPERKVEQGDPVYYDNGTEVGTVSGFTEDGIEVTIPAISPSEEQVRATESAGDRAERGLNPGQGVGEGYLMWRCTECGEMGDLEGGLPERCPNCGAVKRAIYRARED